MANKGLKSYTKQIGGSVGVINYYVNVNKDDSNLILDIPVLESGGINPINLSLIYNHQNRAIRSKYGAGINTSYDYKLNEIDSNTINITNPDGSIDSYSYSHVVSNGTYPEYYYNSQETNMELVKALNGYDSGNKAVYNYYLRDRYGNGVQWLSNEKNYIKAINYKNGFNTSYNISNTTLINNGKGKTITCTYNNITNNINEIYVNDGENNVMSCRLTINPNNNKLMTIIISNSMGELERYYFNFEDSYIRIKDDKRHYGVKFTLEEDRVVSIHEEYYSEEEVDEGHYEYILTDSLLLYDITYFDNKTWVEDKYGKYLYMVFEDGLLSYEYDDKYNFIEYKYNKETKRIKFQGLPININEIKESKIELSEPNIELEEITPSSLLLNSGFSKEYKITNQKLEYDISYNGKAYEDIMLVMFGLQNEVYTDTNNSKISLKLYNGDTLIEEHYDIFSKSIIDNNYKMMTLGVTSKETFNKIKVILDVVNTNINISNILLFSKAYGTKYTYDEQNNIKEITTGKVSKQNKYEENLIKDQINADSSEYVYDYDEKGNPIKSVTGYGVVVEREYDEETNQLKKKTTITNEGYITEDYTYENGNVKTVSTYYSETGNVVYNYDTKNRVTSVANNILLNEISYNSDSSINETKVTDKTEDEVIASISYTYLDKNIKTVTLTNGTIYQFNYDTRKRLTSITLNGVTIVRYTYDTKDNITKKYYNNNYYEFIYNSDYNLQSVYYNGELRYSYTYSYNKLKSVIDHKTGEIITYNYDLDGKVVEIYDGNNEASNNLRIDYDYDIYKNISNSHKLVKGFNLNEGYDSISKSGGSEASKLNNLFNDNNWYYGTMFTGSAELKGSYENTEFRTVPEGEYSFTTVDEVPCIKLHHKSISYDVIDNHGKISTDGSISFWFKPVTTSVTLFCRYDDSYENGLVIEFDYGQFKVLMRKNEVKEINNVILHDFEKWIFVCLNWRNNYDETGNFINANCDLYINDVPITKTLNEALPTIDNNKYMLGGVYGHDELNLSIVKYSSLMVGLGTSLTQEQIMEYYTLTKEHLFNGTNDINSARYSGYSLYNNIDDYIIYPLHDNLDSFYYHDSESSDLDKLEKKSPVKYKVLSKLSTNESSSFNYNHEIKKYCYTCDNNDLIYEFSNGNSGTVAINAYIESFDQEQYIFESYDNNSKGIAIYIKPDKTVRVKIANTHRYLDDFKINTGWNYFSYSYKKNSDLNYHITVVVNDRTLYDTDIELSCNLDNMNIQIGKARYQYTTTIYDNTSYQTSYPLYGQVEMLAISNNYKNASILKNLKQQLKTLTKTYEYDSTGRVIRHSLHTNGENILSNTITYKTSTRNDKTYITNNVEKEEIKVNDTVLTTREYSNLNGNITNITDSVFGNKSYEYDNRGFLTNDNGTTITYDSNGNISLFMNGLFITKTFTYDSNVKDKLIKVNNDTISYSSNNPLLPSSYKDMLFTYEGTRLTRITINYDDETTIYYDYYYNHQGLRVKKVETYEYTDDRDSVSTTTYYYYDGNRLITEYRNDNDRLDFLYDNNGLLYGFINNKTDKYYYVRDILQNILGIIDSNGNLMVKYDYNAYGELLSVTGTNISLGNRNPFRWKGYYYDKETQLFYCNSRYYLPELCRWISPDSIEYLDPESINGLNLYCYCANNPIMYVDPSGHAFIAALLISMGIAALIGGATAGYSAYQSGERGWDLVADIAGGAIFGAAVGATIALGGAAGLAATGASVAGFGLSTGAALGISVGATAVAGMAKYSLDCVASNENNWNFGGFVLSGVEGALQGAATFGLAFVGGKSGLFNKLGNFRTADAFYINHGGMNTLRAVFWGSKVLIGETLSKVLFVSGSAALARWLIDLMIPDLY